MFLIHKLKFEKKPNKFEVVKIQKTWENNSFKIRDFNILKNCLEKGQTVKFNIHKINFFLIDHDKKQISFSNALNVLKNNDLLPLIAYETFTEGNWRLIFKVDFDVDQNIYKNFTEKISEILNIDLDSCFYKNLNQICYGTNKKVFYFGENVSLKKFIPYFVDKNKISIEKTKNVFQQIKSPKKRKINFYQNYYKKHKNFKIPKNLIKELFKLKIAIKFEFLEKNNFKNGDLQILLLLLFLFFYKKIKNFTYVKDIKPFGVSYSSWHRAQKFLLNKKILKIVDKKQKIRKKYSLEKINFLAFPQGKTKVLFLDLRIRENWHFFLLNGWKKTFLFCMCKNFYKKTKILKVWMTSVQINCFFAFSKYQALQLFKNIKKDFHKKLIIYQKKPVYFSNLIFKNKLSFFM